MHELALLSEVVEAVARACASAEPSAVHVVVVRVGALCGAQPEALQCAWMLASADSVVEGARLVLEHVPAAVWCSHCAAEREIDEYFALRCPVCDSPTANLVRGRELEVAYVELEVPDHA